MDGGGPGSDRGKGVGGHKSNGHSSRQSSSTGDIYKQLIDNDMVKELNDIEAISQQISQHADVLYNSWKTNGMTQGPQFKLSAAQAVSPSLDHSANPLSTNLRERGGNLAVLSQNGTGPQQGGRTNYHTLPNRPSAAGGYFSSPVSGSATLGRSHTFLNSNDQNQHLQSVQQQRSPGSDSSSPRQSTISSPGSSTRESPSRGSSITHISHGPSLTTDVGPLELLASPNLNGNLEDLVSNFVNTDRAKQAARNTISSTIMRRMGSPNGSSSPARSNSPTPSLRGASPLRSPMLTNTAGRSGTPTSPEQISPGRGSMSNMFMGDAGMNTIPMTTNRSPSAFSLNNSDIHAPMQSIFSNSKPNSPISPPVNINKSPKTSVLHVQTQKDNTDSGSIPIPVKHIPIAISPSSSEGLKSPAVLQNVNKNPFIPPMSGKQPDPIDEKAAMQPMKNLFDDFGSVKDPDASMNNMRKRFEEAKQRMALSLPAREGGIRPNSLIGRSFFERGEGGMALASPWGDDPSAFLLEQFRRRNKRRMEFPAAPHPELTPQQKQHISDRGAQGLTIQGAGGMPSMRRLLPGGSVAERVLMFEKSPSMFGDVRVPIQRKEAVQANNTSWMSGSQESASNKQIPEKKERIVPIAKIETDPVSQSSVPHLGNNEKVVTQQDNSSSSSPTQINGSSSPGLTPSISPLQAPSATTKGPSTTPSGLLSSLSRVRRIQPSTTFRPPSLHLPSNKEQIPKFYFPQGNPAGKTSPDAMCKKLTDAFSKYPAGVNIEELGQVLKTAGLPLYWKCPVFQVSGGVEKLSSIQLTKAWRRLTISCHDEAAQFVAVLTSGARQHLVPEDLVPLIQDVVDTHPGLLFLKEATEFHGRYVHTVIARIFYDVNRSWSGRISVSELRRSKLISTMRLIQEEDDINQITDFFSYEHFYVIYCKFWELDKDHDLFIDREDLARHNDHALSTRMIERIFCGSVTRGSAQKEGKMSYTEFVWFLLSEEDKRHPTAIEYWFRCMDLDGDGVLSMYELEYFYEEQLQRMEQLGIETLPYDDCLCQMLDMIRPSQQHQITLKDLKRCKMTPVFFDTFFNLEKYLDHEQRDPFATQRETDEEGNEMSDWDRFAAEEYELLVAEEGTTDPLDDMCYEEGDAGGQMRMDDSSLDAEMIKHGDPPAK